MTIYIQIYKKFNKIDHKNILMLEKTRVPI